MKKVKWGVIGTADIARGCTIPLVSAEFTLANARTLDKILKAVGY